MGARILIFSVFLFCICVSSCKKEKKELVDKPKNESSYYMEKHRPQFHFSPEKMWMNDPNGMVYHKGDYHLFYQYYPDSTVWGPMHWGHAISKDLIKWEHQPIGLCPDDLGYIFSGSAVVDKDNTSGFGEEGEAPLVAIFTYHDPVGEKEGKNTFQTQGIAYSTDDGKTWVKYDGNPVIPNEGIRDFRDPKVMWHEETGQWIMTLVAGDHAQFFSSSNLKEWKLNGTFGKDKGAHGGVWECPDLFKMKVEGSEEEKWVLLISINPGAPNQGSGTQYFVGEFDGKTFTTEQKEHLWVDWGTDNYAGVTYSNAPNDDKIFIGWMSNWMYAQVTPTKTWRSAMTLPRKLNLQRDTKGHYLLYSYPVKSFSTYVENKEELSLEVAPNGREIIKNKNLGQSEISFIATSKDFQLELGNDKGEVVEFGFDAEGNFMIDRSKSGKVDFQEGFGTIIQKMPVVDLPKGPFEVKIVVDWSSAEVFLNKGQYVMTAQVFPNDLYNQLVIKNESNVVLEINNLEISAVERVW